MTERDDVRVGRLILVPAIITLAVTLARLAGELAKPRPDFPPMGPWGLFFWTAMLPQLSIWIWMTIAVGMIFAGLAAAVGRAGSRT